MRSTFCAAVLVFAAAARGEIRPSFYLEGCSWFATHVVVVTEGEEMDGNVTVLESWKGDLTPGGTLSVPGLAAFREEASRAIRKSFFDPFGRPPSHVTGTRMILFLTTSSTRSWEGANDGNLQTSVLWIEGGEAFGFFQEVNPGDTLLVDAFRTEAEVRARFAQVDETHRSLDRAMAIEEPAARAKALAPFTTAELYYAGKAAFDGMRSCGPAAVPALRELLHDETKLRVHADAIDALAAIGGEAVDDDLVEVVRDGLAYWKATAPRLQEEWWNAIEDPALNERRDQYGRLYHAVLALQKRKGDKGRAVVAALRDFWRSVPQLEDRRGLDQMSRACDVLLKARE